MHTAEVKNILSAQNGLNAYRGCTHGCIYCDARSDCYGFKHEFDDVEIKINAPELLKSTIKRKKTPCMIGTGAMGDPYNPYEGRFKITRKILETAYEFNCGATLNTKSADVIRDLDILKKINENAKCVVQMTVTTADDSLQRIIEPNVSSTSERIQALNILKEAGIPTVVWLCPILPFINDTEQNVGTIVDECAWAGVRGILYFGAGVTLRSGNREYFYKKLDEFFPGIKNKYINTFKNSYVCNSKNADKLNSLFYEKCKKYGIMCDNGHIFEYLRTLPQREIQLKMF